MTRTALLLLDLQRDFLEPKGRMPVDAESSAQVVAIANMLTAIAPRMNLLPIVIHNQFPVSDWIGNFFRRYAAIVGSDGAKLDVRITGVGEAKVFAKSQADAFSNPALDQYLKTEGVKKLTVLGVFAEGCVRATVSSALQRGYEVTVIQDAIASNRSWKERCALWAMRKAGAKVVNSTDFLGSPPAPTRTA